MKEVDLFKIKSVLVFFSCLNDGFLWFFLRSYILLRLFKYDRRCLIYKSLAIFIHFINSSLNEKSGWFFCTSIHCLNRNTFDYYKVIWSYLTRFSLFGSIWNTAGRLEGWWVVCACGSFHRKIRLLYKKFLLISLSILPNLFFALRLTNSTFIFQFSFLFFYERLFK